MSVLTATDAIAAPRLATESLRSALLWLTGVSGAFVFIEPSPYEYVALATIFLFALTGFTLRAALAPLIVLLIVLNVGYATSLIQVIDQTRLVIWVVVSAYLAVTAMFYAAMLGAQTESRLKWLLRGTQVAGFVAAIVAVAAYFRLLGGASDLFLLFGRARGTFNDPNVLGAFLVLPALLAFQRVLAGRLTAVIGSGLVLLVLLAALLLSFSRGAWGQMAFAAVALMAMTFLTSRSNGERLRILLIAIGGALVIAAFVAVLVSTDQVADLFKQRASFDQSYDLGYLGRFGRYSLGAQLALESPLGIGPLQFPKFFPEDPHNTFLNAFMSGGWLAGLSYLTLSAVTVAAGMRFVFVRTPWQPAYHVIYAAYLGVVAESAIVDIDHWRHYFLILGVLWGLISVSRNYRAAAPRTA
ncbi:MAG: hypothetical protein QOG83_2011 [Alphaproteobacteria bacterium]|nr:hypothetical protein [Alphaproteobacteria bacterium]